MREFFKSIFSFGLASVIEKLIVFLLLPIYTHFFSTVEFGVIDLMQVILGTVGIFALLQLETALQRYYYEFDGQEKTVFISSIFFIIISLSILLALLLIVFSTETAELIFKNETYSNLIKLSALQLPFINFTMLALVLLRYEKQNLRFGLMVSLKVILNVAFVIVLVVWLKRGLYGLFYAQLISLILSSVFLLLYIRPLLTLNLSIDLIKKSIKYAIPQFPARVGSLLLTYANRFFMLGYLTVAAIGLYSLALKLASVIQLADTAFVMAWAPFMFEQHKKEGHQKIFAYMLPLVASPIFLIVSIISMLSKEIIFFVASKQFQSSFHFIGCLALYFSLLIFKEVVDIGPKFTEKTRFLSYTFFLSVVVNLVSLYFFIRPYGLYGVIYSMLVTNAVLLIVSWVVSNRLYYIPYNMPMFVFMAIPAFSLAIMSMYILPPLIVRVFILILLSIFYATIFIKFLRKQKNIGINVNAG